MLLAQNQSGLVLRLCAVVVSHWLAATACAAQASAAEDVRPVFGVRLGAGGGLGHRAVMAPSRAGDRALDSALFPTVSVSLDGAGELAGRWLLGLRIHYQTSLALQAREQPAAGSGTQTSLRSQRVEVGITPGLRLSASAPGPELRVFAGWGLRSLRAVTAIALPPYTLHGPVLRPELRVPFSNGSAELRIAPELQLVSGISQDLRELSDTASTGLCWGGEIALSIRLGGSARMDLAYREARASVGSAWGRALTDIERFGTLGLNIGF